ncbi:MAG: FAD-dependent oxidoreductase [Flavobacteriales bacterium]|nr:FAD-dependent oxidoreductase [Flavobacteriales bacterium]
MSETKHRIVIVGAGLAGLSAGVFLKRKGYNNILFVDKSDRPGGKLKTDLIDGYTLNHSNSLINSHFKYLNELIDLSSLKMHYLEKGALVMKGSKLEKIIHPFSKNFLVYKMLFADFGNFKDKIRFIKKRIELDQLDEEELFDSFELKTKTYLKKKGFSSSIIHGFFEPYFSTFFMENELSASRRLFDYILKNHTAGKNGIPEGGTESLINELTKEFDKDSFILNTNVEDYKDEKVFLKDGRTLDCNIFILATEQNELYDRLKKDRRQGETRSTTTLYFSANNKPFKESLICVNSEKPKLVSSVTVLTNLSSSFAPKNKELICVSLNGFATTSDEDLEKAVKSELQKAFGNEVQQWNHIKTYKNLNAISNQEAVFGRRRIVELRPEKGIYLCGDHLLYGSINAAVKTGKMIAELVNYDHNKDTKVQKSKKYSDLFN